MGGTRDTRHHTGGQRRCRHETLTLLHSGRRGGSSVVCAVRCHGWQLLLVCIEGLTCYYESRVCRMRSTPLDTLYKRNSPLLLGEVVKLVKPVLSFGLLHHAAVVEMLVFLLTGVWLG